MNILLYTLIIKIWKKAKHHAEHFTNHKYGQMGLIVTNLHIILHIKSFLVYEARIKTSIIFL